MEAAIRGVTGGVGIRGLIKKAALYTVSVVYFPGLRSGWVLMGSGVLQQASASPHASLAGKRDGAWGLG